MYLTKKHIPRRAFLRGVGVSLSLPFLDSMVPAQTPLARTAASPRSRLACIYVPHGAVMDLWTPAADGTNFELPEILKPLEKLKDQINIISNLAHPQAGGDGSSSADRSSNRAADRSILEAVRGEVATLKNGIPAADRSRLDEYLDNIREIERRIQKSEEKTNSELAEPEAPVGVPELFDEH